MATFDVEIVETRRFEMDRAMYGLENERYERALKVLRFDPIVGIPRAEISALWDWEFDGHRLTYALSDDLSKIMLLRFTPSEAPKANRLSKALAAIRIINEIKRLFGF